MKLLKEIDTKKTVDFDMIPPKLDKTAFHVLCSPLYKAINNNLLQGVFPDDAKIALFYPFDKGISKKIEISNFRPFSIFITFSKIYEKVAKRFLEADMNKFLFPFLSASRKNYNTQHALICLAEEWIERLDNNYVVESSVKWGLLEKTGSGFSRFLTT